MSSNLKNLGPRQSIHYSERKVKPHFLSDTKYPTVILNEYDKLYEEIKNIENGKRKIYADPYILEDKYCHICSKFVELYDLNKNQKKIIEELKKDIDKNKETHNLIVENYEKEKAELMPKIISYDRLNHLIDNLIDPAKDLINQINLFFLMKSIGSKKAIDLEDREKN